MTPALNDEANTNTESGENPILSILASPSPTPDVNVDEDLVGDVGVPPKADTEEQTSEKTTSRFFESRTTNLALEATTAR